MGVPRRWMEMELGCHSILPTFVEAEDARSRFFGFIELARWEHTFEVYCIGSTIGQHLEVPIQ